MKQLNVSLFTFQFHVYIEDIGITTDGFHLIQSEDVLSLKYQDIIYQQSEFKLLPKTPYVDTTGVSIYVGDVIQTSDNRHFFVVSLTTIFDPELNVHHIIPPPFSVSSSGVDLTTSTIIGTFLGILPF